MSRKQLFNLLKIIVSIALIYLIVSNIQLEAVIQALSRANLAWLLAAQALVFVGIVVRAKRWQILLDALLVHVPLPELTRIYFIGFLFNNLLPSGLGGDAIRMLELNRHTDRAGDAVSSVLVDRLLGLFGSLTLALIALIFWWNAVPPQIAWFSIAIFVGLILAGIVLTNARLYHTLRRISIIRRITGIKFISGLFESFQTYSLSALGRSFLVSLLFNALLIAQNFTIGLALGVDIPLVYYLVFVPITSLVLVLPISFAGLGVREGAYVYLFGQVGVPAAVALSMSLLIYFLGNVIPGLFGGVIYIIRGAKGWRLEKEM